MGAEDVHIREQDLPRIGRRFDLDVEDGLILMVVAARDGSRDIAVREPGADEPRGTVHLRREQAVAVGSLLLGARFSDGSDAGASESSTGRGVDVGTVVLGDRSPAVGMIPAEIAFPGDAEAAVVAVARDDTRQLLEDDRHRACEPGDRLVVAARGDHLEAVLEHLAG